MISQDSYTLISQILDSIIKIAAPIAIAAFVKFYNAKKTLVTRELYNSEHTQFLTYAREAWGIVDEHFRVHDKLSSLIEDKKAEFTKAILIKAPQLDSVQIASLRQTVAAEMAELKKQLAASNIISAGTIEGTVLQPYVHAFVTDASESTISNEVVLDEATTETQAAKE